jgi:tellurite resistance protein TerC
MITLGVYLIQEIEWIFYIFGAILIYSAFKIAVNKDSSEEVKAENVKFIQFVKKFLPVTDKLHGNSFVQRVGNKFYFTPLFIVLLIIEKTDLIFAIDSIPAILAITNDTFIVFTSNIFAIIGLRSLYFLLANLMDRFVYLKYGIAIILGFVGVKMLFAVSASHIPVQFSLLFIIGVLATSILLSWMRSRKTR